MHKRDFYYTSVNGKNSLHAIEWLPEGPVRACVQLVHGVSEYIDRYDRYANFLTEHGIAVVGNDHLGHGKSVASPEELGWFGEKNGWNLVVEDLKKLHMQQKAAYPDVPFFLFGHSMGSFLARTYIINYPRDFDGVILSGTAWQPGYMCAAGLLLAGLEIRLHGTQYKSELLRKIAFGSYLNKIPDAKTENDWLTRDEQVVSAYCEDPLCGYTSAAGLMRDMMTGLNFIRKKKNIRKMAAETPVYILSGAEDPVGAWSKGVRKTEKAFRACGLKRTELKLYPGARHEILNELNREEVYADTLMWLEKNM